MKPTIITRRHNGGLDPRNNQKPFKLSGVREYHYPKLLRLLVFQYSSFGPSPSQRTIEYDRGALDASDLCFPPGIGVAMFSRYCVCSLGTFTSWKKRKRISAATFIIRMESPCPQHLLLEGTWHEHTRH